MADRMSSAVASISTQLVTLRQRAANRPLMSTALLTTITFILYNFILDYRRFIKLGKGGVPHNIIGYAIVTLLRPIALSKQAVISSKDFDFDSSPPTTSSVISLPPRQSDRPIVADIVPQRQLSDQAPTSIGGSMYDLFDKIVASNPTLLEKKRSHYERHNEAIWVRQSVVSSPAAAVPETCTIATGEIGHIHHDLSVHLYFSPNDAKHVLAKGWGERHRLARKIFGRPVMGADRTYIFIYGPRNEAELEVLRTLLNASVKFMLGKEGDKMVSV